jgi:hypothetical protein
VWRRGKASFGAFVFLFFSPFFAIMVSGSARCMYGLEYVFLLSVEAVFGLIMVYIVEQL